MMHSGEAVPFAERPVPLLGAIAFPIPPADAPQTLYVRVRTIEPDLTIGIDSSSLLWQLNQWNELLIVGLDSILLAMLVSSLVLFGMSRAPLYALYAIYVFAELLTRSTEIGLSAALLWPHAGISGS